MIQTEVLIVGGGPAGAACAWRLKRHGIDFLLLDKAAFPRNKTCAGWITPRVLQDLELDPESYPGSLTTYTKFNIEIRNWKFNLRTVQYGIRRIEFDAWQIQRVADHLVTHAVSQIELVDGKYLVDGEYAARFLVGAGGTQCPVKRRFFNSSGPGVTGQLIIAQEEEFEYPGADPTCRLWFLQDGLPGYAWYFPKENGVVNVGIGGSAAGIKAAGKTLYQHWDQLVEKLKGLGLVRDHIFNPKGYSYHLRPKRPELRIGNALLVGDALGMATLDMGEGIAPSVQSGLRAADAIFTVRPYNLKGISRYSFPSLLRLP